MYDIIWGRMSLITSYQSNEIIEICIFVTKELIFVFLNIMLVHLYLLCNIQWLFKYKN